MGGWGCTPPAPLSQIRICVTFKSTPLFCEYALKQQYRSFFPYLNAPLHFSRCMIDGLKKIYLSCFFYTRVLKVISFSSLPPYFCPRVLSMVLYLVCVGGNCPRPARRSVRSPTKRAVAEQFVSRSLTPRKFSISFLMV